MASQKTLEHYLRQLRLIEEHREKWCEENVRRHYKDLMKDLREFLGVEYAKLAVDDKLTYEILHQKGQYARFIEEVSTRMDKVCRKVGQEVKDTVHLTYQKCFEGMVDAVTKSKDYDELKVNLKGVRAITPDQVKNVVSNTFLEDALEKNHKESIYTIKQQVGVGLSQGDRMSTMAKRLSEQIDKDYNKSIRIVRTETHRVREAGFQDASMRIQEHLDEADSDYVVVKTWKTMKDGAVRPQRLKGKKGAKTIVIGRGPNHMKMHGVTVLVDEMFDLGAGAKAMTPGQSGVAGHDINCRCVLIRDLMTREEYIKKIGKEFKKEDSLAHVDKTEKSWKELFDENSIEYTIHGDMVSFNGQVWPIDEIYESKFVQSLMGKIDDVKPVKFIKTVGTKKIPDAKIKKQQSELYKLSDKITVPEVDGTKQCHTSVSDLREYLKGKSGYDNVQYVMWDENKWTEVANELKKLKFVSDSEDINNLIEDIADFTVNGHSFIRLDDSHFVDPYLQSLGVSKKQIDEFDKVLLEIYQKVGIVDKVDDIDLKVIRNARLKSINISAQYETQEKNLLDERVKYESEKEKLRQYQDTMRSKKYTDIFVDPVTPADYEAKKRNLASARKKIQDKIDSVSDDALDDLFDTYYRMYGNDLKEYNRQLRNKIGLQAKEKYDLRWTDLDKYKHDPEAVKAYVRKQAAKYRDDLAKQFDVIDEFEKLGKEYVKYSKDIQRLDDRIKGVNDDLVEIRKQIMKAKDIDVDKLKDEIDDLKKQLADAKKAVKTLDPKWKKVYFEDDPYDYSVSDYLSDFDVKDEMDDKYARAKKRLKMYPDEQRYKDRLKAYDDFFAQIKQAQDEMVDPKIGTLEKLIKGKQDELDDIVKRYELKVTGSYAPRTQSAKILDNLQAHADNNISKFNRTFDEIARANNLDVSVVRDELNKALGEIINDCDIGMRKSVGTIERLLKDPDNEYIKNLFETGGSGGCSNKSVRGGGEVSVFGYKTNLPNLADDLAEDRPIYGMMIPKLDGSTQAKDYINNGPGSWYGGGVTIVIDKNKVFNNASFTLGDSLDYSHDLCGSTFDNPQFNGAWYNFKSASKNLLNPNKSSSEKLIETFTSGDKYMEVQIHGRENKGIDIVERVYFTTRNAFEDAERRGLLDLLDQRNIPWEKLF